MHELILANLLFHAAAGTALVLMAAGSATRDLHHRRPVRTLQAVVREEHAVIAMPVNRLARPTREGELETQSEAA